MSDKKEFKDTKVGKLIGKFAGILPDKGVLSIVKNLIEEDDTLTPEQKKEASERLIRLYEAEVSDRDSARKREAEVRKYGFDFLFNITGLVILGAFAFLVYVITNAEVPPSNKEIFIHLIGIVEGSVISVVGYYFGTSMKKDK
jgi:hypothetical protein